MTTPASTPPEEPPGRRTGWLALTASQRGAAHIASRLPNQDAVVAEPAGLDGVVAAVADGHGHWRHARSARGSALAVGIGCQAGQELAALLEDDEVFSERLQAGPDAPPVASQISDLALQTLVPDVVERWRDAVLADVAADPFTDEEQEARQDGDDPTIAYGSTLLLAVAVGQWLVLAQIGDGDIVGVRADGGAALPVPDDPQLDGRFTTSLCGADARSDFRVAVVDVWHAPLAAVLLATDGYGNAQIADQWADAFSKDLAEMLRERDDHWLATQLPMWAARCASSDGSADDTTVALLLGPPGWRRTVTPMAGPGGLVPDVGSEETTVPAVIHSATIPNDRPAAGQGPAEPITTRLDLVPPEPTATEPDTVRLDPVPPEPTATGPEAATEPETATEPATETEPATMLLDRVPAEQATSDAATAAGPTTAQAAEPPTVRLPPVPAEPRAAEPTATEPATATEPVTAIAEPEDPAQWTGDR